jgi:hypothetical protein
MPSAHFYQLQIIVMINKGKNPAREQENKKERIEI